MADYGFISIDNNTVQDANGAGVSGVAVYVYELGTDTLATLYSSDSGGSKSNPLTTDANGVFSAYAAAGFYDLKIVHASYSEEWRRNVQVVTVTTYPENVREITEADDVTTDDQIVEVDSTAGNVIVTMMAIAGVAKGRPFGIVKRSSDANTARINDALGVEIATLTLQDEGVWISRNQDDAWKVTGRF